jgi:hypothetical protein
MLVATLVLRMRSPFHSSTSSRWPFWLLALAWVCANCPLVVSYAAVWIGEARSFSHQQRLTADVARVLAGEEPSSMLAAVDNIPVESPKPAVPPTDAVKKIEMATESSLFSVAPMTPDTARLMSVSCLVSALPASPPHEPPRAAVVS